MYNKLVYNVILCAAGLFLACVAPATADYTKRVCGGEGDKDKCPVATDIMIGCNPTEEDAVKAACTIISGGQKKVLDGHADNQGSHEGGKCGYRWYGVTCFQKRVTRARYGVRRISMLVLSNCRGGLRIVGTSSFDSGRTTVYLSSFSPVVSEPEKCGLPTKISRSLSEPLLHRAANTLQL